MSRSDQAFATFGEWDAHAETWLARDDRRGAPVCLDAKGRLCEDANDFYRAKTQGTFPVRWFWPDQLVNGLGTAIAEATRVQAAIARLERWCGLAGKDGYDREVVEAALEEAAANREGQAAEARMRRFGT